MITGQNKNPLSKLTREDRKKLAVLLVEAENRGINVMDRIQAVTKKTWPVDSNGYFTNESGKQYIPTPSQEAFIKSTARFSAFIGGRGSGKTAAGAQKALKRIMQGQSGAVLNPDFENFRTSTWPEFKLWIPWDMVVPRQRFRANADWEPLQPFVLTFLNGVRVICKGVKDPDSARGPNINWLWYDEGARDETGLSWKIAIPSVRVGKLPQAWVTCTPNGIYHWVYKFFVEQEIPENVLKAFSEIEEEIPRELVEVYYGSIYDNKENLDPSFYVSMLAAYSDDPLLRKQELDGAFVQQGETLGDSSWFDGKIIDSIPLGEGNESRETIIKRVRYWDLAASEKKVIKKRKLDPDETTGTRLAWNGGKVFYIEDQIGGQWEWDTILNNILKCALEDGPQVEIHIEQEPGSGGKNQIAAIKKYLEDKIKETLGYMPSYVIKEHVPEGDKIMRANIWFREAKNGFFYLIKGAWNKDFLAQLDGFPGGKHDDRIDGVSGARMVIAPILLWKDIKFMTV